MKEPKVSICLHRRPRQPAAKGDKKSEVTSGVIPALLTFAREHRQLA